MQECPSCLESFKDEELVLPHCKKKEHSACRACTMQWYEKQSNETCMVCRTGKSCDTNKDVFIAFGFGVMFSILSVLIMVLKDWFILMLKTYTFGLFYIFFKHRPTSTAPKQLFFVFFVGINVTLYLFIVMFIYINYTTCKSIIYVIYNFMTMFINILSLHLACSLCSIEETRQWMIIVNLMNKIASVGVFCLHLLQIINVSD